MKEMSLEVKDLCFRYDPEADLTLDHLSLSAYKGEWLAIAGHNGSGKSTLARILNGLLLPEKGTVRVGDTLLSEETIWDVRKQIGMVFQNPDNQFVGSTVQDDIAFGLENNGIPFEIMEKRIPEAIEMVNMSAFLEQEPHQLSGGQKQRVAIAGIIAVQPSVIILDEATSMLDPIGRTEVLETVRKLKEEKQLTVISITHDLDEVAMADRVVVMNKGKIYATGTPREVFALGSKLTDIGLDLPFSVKLSHRFASVGIPLSKIHLTDEDLVDELWILYSKK
ncbi:MULTISPECIES: energy-coupling factor ABC transporter ATP-binding protein [Priestia]|uniref:energy-coupling factor ABC transporter ATP-binding protein n=1 Tax=Priestia TaxID=2800373 RepID=UPI00203FA639|nr:MULTISPECIES: energy-coupling factor ABC transporter ATP-binding protein [Priestia]MCM3773965.1 energy-coupling factor ABC transporter ATP-binding protein [Priestia aryabhattai]MDY0943444.1 energy-coupling factor ABC transporter ATP-binding protein [Priestia megaterium]